MPNPYAVEYGRFSSGLVVIQTRRGGDAWHVRLNNLSPTFRSKRHEDLYNINGIAGFGPELRARRPDRQEPRLPRADRAVPLQQRRRAEPSRRRAAHHALDQLVHARRRQPDRRSTRWSAPPGSSRASPRWPSLGTFTPPDATVDVHERVHARHRHRARAVERRAGVGVDRPGARLPGVGAAAGHRADAAAAGDDARQLLQHAVPLADDVSVHPDRVGLGQGAHRAAPLQGRPRSARSTTTTAPATAGRS